MHAAYECKRTHAWETMRLTSKLTKVSVYSPVGNRDGNLEGTPAYLPGSPHHPGGILKGGKAAGGYYGDDDWGAPRSRRRAGWCSSAWHPRGRSRWARGALWRRVCVCVSVRRPVCRPKFLHWPKRLPCDSASAGAATQQIAPPTRAPAGRGPTDARHSRHAHSRSHHGHRAATVTS